MTNRKLKKMLRSEKAYFVRDTKVSVLSCTQGPVKEKRLHFSYQLVLMGLLVIFGIVGILQSKPNSPTNYSNSILLIDINPSIQFEIDDDGNLVSYEALNEDAVVLLSSLNLVIGSPYLIEIEKVIEEAKIYGYLVDQQVIINPVNDDKEKESSLREELLLKFNNNSQVTINNEVSNLNHVSTGKLVLINKLLDRNPNLVLDELTKLEVNELAKMINALDKDKINQVKNRIDQFKDGQEEALEEMVTELKVFEDNVKALINKLETEIDEANSKALDTYRELRILLPNLNEISDLETLSLIIDDLEDDIIDYIEDRTEELKEGFELDLKSSIDDWKKKGYTSELTIKTSFNESFINVIKDDFKPVLVISKNDRAFLILLNRLEKHLNNHGKSNSYIQNKLAKAIYDEINSYIEADLVSEEVLESDYFESVMDHYDEIFED